MEQVRAFFDASPDAEWERLVVDPRSRVSFEIHRRFLREYVRSGDRVLEIGAGPGRFTIELATIGARVVVTDYSPVQLEHNARRVAQAGCEQVVEDRRVVDITDLSEFADDSFDVVLAYGGPLSYVFERAPIALAECVRVTCPGGYVVMSVMSTLGSALFFLSVLLDEIDACGIDATEAELATGDTREVSRLMGRRHVCRMFRWRDLTDLFAGVRAELVGASASNCMSLGDQDALQSFADDDERWARFVEWEAEMCREPGALDGGTHILFALRRP